MTSRRDFLKTTAATVAATSLGAPAIAQSAAKTLRFVPQANLANPDPTRTVEWGEQTWDEMLIGYLDYIEDQSIQPCSRATK